MVHGGGRSNVPRGPEQRWDEFIDALDRAGQAGGAQDVLVPDIGTGMLAGRRFGDLTRDDAKQLARVASALARRGETLMMLWEDTQRKLRPSAKKLNRNRRTRG